MMKVILMNIMLVAFLFLQACSVSESETSVTILNGPVSLNPGETFQLELEVNNPSGLRIHFQTSNRDVLIVDDQGVVYGVSKGVASITVSIGSIVSEPVVSNVLSVPGEFIFNLIDNLSSPYVREEVIAARGGYEALDEAEKLKVTNINVLEDAEAYFDEIDEAFEAIANVVYPYIRADFDSALELYDNLTDEQEAYMTNRINLANAENYFYEIDDVMFEIQLLSEPYDVDSVAYVRGMYEELALSQQALITNYQDLLDAEAYVLLYEEALEVERMIHSLQLPYDTAEVNAARNAYDALTLEQQTMVSNLSELEVAEQVLLDIAAASVVSNLIDALTEPFDQTAVTNARNSYADLTGSQQAYVTNLSKLEAAEQVLLDIAAAQTVIDVIDTITEPYNEVFIIDIRVSYENLTASQKVYVTNLSTLEAAEQALLDLAAAKLVIEEIDDLSSDPIDGDAVGLARASYDALTSTQQALVTNLNILTTLESELVDIQIARAFDVQVEASAMFYQGEFISNSTEDIDYGYSIASNDRYVVIGAPKDSGTVTNSGLVYIYDLNDASVRILDASNAKNGARFGESVSISGDYVLVGAPIAGDNSSGRAYVYKISDDTFERIIRSSDAASGDRFGYSVAIDDDLIVVSAHSDDDLGNESGSIYRYSILNTAFEAKTIASDGGFNHYFGWRVEINQSLIAVSAYAKTVDGKSFAGGVYVYDRFSGIEVFKIEAFDSTSSKSFGQDIALTETHLIVGAIGDSKNGSGSGGVYVYDLSNINNVRKITASDGASFDHFGYSVAANDNQIFVSARGDDDQGNNSGSLYVYQFADFTYEYKMTLDDGIANDLFGHHLHVGSKTLYVGAINRNTGGSVLTLNIGFLDVVPNLRDTYDALTLNQKTYVQSLDTLVQYETLISDIEAFKTLIVPIRDVGTFDNLSPDPSVLLDPANTAYEAFSQIEQLLLDPNDVKVLYDANTYFDEIDEVIEAIALNIFSSKALKVEARQLYEALDNTQQSLVTNYDRLVQAEQITSLDFASATLLIDTGVSNIKQMEATDLDFDGDLDYVYATQNAIGVIMNDGSSYTASTIDTFSSGNDFTFGLIDSDGEFIKDIVIQDPESTFLIIYDNNANGTFTKRFISGGLVGDSNALIVADINEDGSEDFVYISSNVNALSYVENNQDGTFTIRRLSTSSTYQIIDIDVVDIDSDGDLDIVSISSNQSNIKLFLNDGSETFTVRNINTTISLMTDVVTGDFNGDNIVDILVAHQERSSTGYLLSYTKRFVNDGSLSFTMNSESAYGHTLGTLIAGDLEGDGDLDVLHTETTIPGYTQNFVLGVFIMRQFAGELGTDYLNFIDVSTVLLIDENNDGLSDIVYVLPDGKIYIAINEYEPAIIND